MSKKMTIKWLAGSAAHDFPAARSYLSLIYPTRTAAAMVRRLRRARASHFKAKDIFRASGLSLLGVSAAHVERYRKRIRAGHGLSPLLLIRTPAAGPVILADGYHRLCAVYAMDEDAEIPCRIV